MPVEQLDGGWFPGKLDIGLIDDDCGTLTAPLKEIE
jgi:hypothetical protein